MKKKEREKRERGGGREKRERREGEKEIERKREGWTGLRSLKTEVFINHNKILKIKEMGKNIP